MLFCSVREQKGGVVAGMQCMGKVVWVFAFYLFYLFFLVVEIISHLETIILFSQLKTKIDHTKNRFIVGAMALNS